MTDYFKADERRMLFRRIEQISADSRSRSGKVNGHQLILHFNAGLRELLNPVAAQPQATQLNRLNWLLTRVIKWLVFHLTPWPESEPRDAATMANFVGAQPAQSFADDHAQFVALLQRFDAASRADTLTAHPQFGVLTRDEWGQYMFLHIDYHLSTFDIHGDFRDRLQPGTRNART